MVPNITVNTKAMTLLGADTTTFDNTGGIDVALQTDPVTPSPTTTPADLVEPTWSGYARVNTAAAPIVPTVDPATGDIQLTVPPPAGGWTWVSGAGTYPVQVFGFMAISHTSNTNLGYEFFPVPITITAAGQQIEVPIARVMLQSGALS